MEIIGLDIGSRDGSMNSKSKLDEFIRRYNIIYPITKGDATNQIFTGLQNLNPTGSIPFMVLFNANGQYIRHYVGMIPADQLHNDIANLIKK